MRMYILFFVSYCICTVCSADQYMVCCTVSDEACCTIPDIEQNIPWVRNLSLLKDMQRPGHNNGYWTSDLLFDSRTGEISLSVTCLADKAIQICLGRLFDPYMPYNSKKEIDPDFEIQPHYNNRKMEWDELMAYMETMSPIEKRLLDVNERIFRYIAGSLPPFVHRFVDLHEGETVSRKWKINSLHNWDKIRDYLKQYPDKVDITKSVLVLKEGQIEYMLKRCPIDYSSIRGAERRSATSRSPSVSIRNSSLTLDPKTGDLTVTLFHEVPDPSTASSVRVNLDESFGYKEDKRNFFAAFTAKSPKTDEIKAEQDFPSSEPGEFRIFDLEDNESVGKECKIWEISIWPQLVESLQANRAERFTLRYPVRVELLGVFDGVPLNEEGFSIVPHEEVAELTIDYRTMIQVEKLREASQ